MSESIEPTAATEPTDPAPVTPAASTDPQPTPQAPPKPEVPADYKIDVPQGMHLDEKAADEFKAFAKEKGFSQEDVQKAVGIVAQMNKQQADKHLADITAWQEAVKTDKEFGGEKFNENIAVAQRAVQEFGTEGLFQILEATGFQYHPEVVRAFYRIGKKMANDTFVTGRPPQSAQVDPAKALFPNQN